MNDNQRDERCRETEKGWLKTNYTDLMDERERSPGLGQTRAAMLAAEKKSHKHIIFVLTVIHGRWREPQKSEECLWLSPGSSSAPLPVSKTQTPTDWHHTHSFLLKCLIHTQEKYSTHCFYYHIPSGNEFRAINHTEFFCEHTQSASVWCTCVCVWCTCVCVCVVLCPLSLIQSHPTICVLTSPSSITTSAHTIGSHSISHS